MIAIKADPAQNPEARPVPKPYRPNGCQRLGQSSFVQLACSDIADEFYQSTPHQLWDRFH